MANKPASVSVTSSGGESEDAVLIGAVFCSSYTVDVPFATSARMQFETDFDPDPDMFTQRDVPRWRHRFPSFLRGSPFKK